MHPNDAAVLIDGFRALSALSRAESNAVQIIDEGLNLITRALKMHSKNVKVIEAALKFLANLCVYQSGVELVLQMKVVPMVLEILDMRPTEAAILIRGCQALANIAYGSKECTGVMEHLKECQVISIMEKIKSENSKRIDVKGCAQTVIDAMSQDKTQGRTASASATSPSEMKKATFSRYKEPVLEQEARNLLNAGSLLILHSREAPSKPKHVFVDSDLRWLICKDPKGPILSTDKHKTIRITQVLKGRLTPVLQRTNLFGKDMTQDEKVFAVVIQTRTLDFEAGDEYERNKWVSALEALIKYKTAMKKWRKSFGTP